MDLIVVDNYNQMSERAAEIFVREVKAKPDLNVVLATGNTPMGMYGKLAEMKSLEQFDSSRLQVFMLDGYLGLDRTDPRSLEGWLRRTVLDPWAVPEERFISLCENASDPEAICKEYEARVRSAGGFDIAVLGLGPNGHLGFNEPGSSADSITRVVPLTEESITSNAVYWGGREFVPRTSVTAGMNLLLSAKHILLLVSGEKKQEILRKTIYGPVTPDVPASLLRNTNATIIADRAACPGWVP